MQWLDSALACGFVRNPKNITKKSKNNHQVIQKKSSEVNPLLWAAKVLIICCPQLLHMIWSQDPTPDWETGLRSSSSSSSSSSLESLSLYLHVNHHHCHRNVSLQGVRIWLELYAQTTNMSVCQCDNVTSWGTHIKCLRCTLCVLLMPIIPIVGVAAPDDTCCSKTGLAEISVWHTSQSPNITHSWHMLEFNTISNFC